MVKEMLTELTNNTKSLKKQKTEVLTPQEISQILDKSLRWVYKYGYELGGVKIGGSWIFTEENFYNALQARKKMAWGGYNPGVPISETVFHKARSAVMGGTRKKKTAGEDPHGLLA